MAIFRLSSTMAIDITHLWERSKTGPFWFKRGVPKDLVSVVGKKWIQFSLKTRDLKIAARLIDQHAKEQDRQWQELRTPTPTGMVEQGKQLLRSFGVDPADPKAASRGARWAFEGHLDRLLPEHIHEQTQAGHELEPSDLDKVLSPVARAALQVYQGRLGLLVSQVRDEYVAAKTDDAQSVKSATLPFQYLIALCGDRPIEKYRPQDVTAYVQHLLEGKHSPTGKGISKTTVTRYVTPLRAAWAMAMRRHGLKIDNVWAGDLDMPKSARGAVKRASFTPPDYQKLFAAIGDDIASQDDLRCALVILADTGARLAEIIGLRVEDCRLTDAVPHIVIEDYAIRTVKNDEHGERAVPLTPRALQAIRRALELAKLRQPGSAYVFPRYTSDAGCKNTHASNTLNDWIRSRGIDRTCHCMRHGLRDKLRAVDAPVDVVEELQGWAKSAMSSKYGEGHSLERLLDWLKKATGQTC